jgi:hypothetical protein
MIVRVFELARLPEECREAGEAFLQKILGITEGGDINERLLHFTELEVRQQAIRHKPILERYGISDTLPELAEFRAWVEGRWGVSWVFVATDAQFAAAVEEYVKERRGKEMVH